MEDDMPPSAGSPAARDPLVAAILGKIPPAAKAWPLDEQVRLLQLLAMAFGAVYGGGHRISVSAVASASEPTSEAKAPLLPNPLWDTP